jgi:hypothetical protein
MNSTEAQHILQVYDAAGTVRDAAEAFGISKTSFHRKLTQARAFGTVPEGFHMAKLSTSLDAEGNVKSSSVQAKPGEKKPHTATPGLALKRRSALLDADGNVVQEWLIEGEEGKRTVGMIDALKAEFENFEQVAPTAAPEHLEADLLTLYPVVDQHHGLYSWAAETGEDFDLDESRRLFQAALSDLISFAPPSEKCQILGLGDFFHTDTEEAKTVASGNPLDRDGRQSKVIGSGIGLLRWAIDLALTKHKTVNVTVRAGNHDPQSALWLAHCLAIAYENEPRVEVDLDPSLFWYARFGRVLLAATHGHTCKPGEFPSKIAAEVGEAFGATEFRYGYQGHIHHETKVERGGVTVETFQTLSAKDFWHAGRNYTAGRSMQALTFHRDLGLVSMVKSPVLRDPQQQKRVIEL